MEYIETLHRQVDGNNITERYLADKCVVSENGRQVYRNIDYSNTFRPDYSNEMAILLGDVQNDMCCYCMRQLPKGSPQITLEHIIPQSSSIDQFNRYISLGYNELSEINLIHTDVFSGKSISTPRPPLPHAVAYHNFLISCDGSFIPDNNSHLCCNNARQEKLLIPVFFDADIEQNIEYTPSGEAKAADKARQKSNITVAISAAKLNCKPLREIRRIWYCLRHIDLDTIISAVNDRRTKIILIMKHCKDNNLLNKYTIYPYKWELLLSYSWFHSYYKKHYDNK